METSVVKATLVVGKGGDNWQRDDDSSKDIDFSKNDGYRTTSTVKMSKSKMTPIGKTISAMRAKMT